MSVDGCRNVLLLLRLKEQRRRLAKLCETRRSTTAVKGACASHMRALAEACAGAKAAPAVATPAARNQARPPRRWRLWRWVRLAGLCDSDGSDGSDGAGDGHAGLIIGAGDGHAGLIIGAGERDSSSPSP